MNGGEWLFPIRRALHPALRLFAFPYAGAGAQVYCPWARLLPPGIDAWAMQPPGRGSRLGEAPLRDIHALASGAAAAMRPLVGMPFVLFGHSMGALVAFEVARLLRSHHGARPAHLLLSGAGAPDLPALTPPLHGLQEPAFLEKLREYNGTPRDVLDNRELMALLLPMLRADFEACETYRYEEQPPLDSPMTLFGGVRDLDTPPHYFEAWRRHTTGSVRTYWFPGDHFFVHGSTSSFLPTLAGVLTDIAAGHEPYS